MTIDRTGEALGNWTTQDFGSYGRIWYLVPGLRWFHFPFEEVPFGEMGISLLSLTGTG